MSLKMKVMEKERKIMITVARSAARRRRDNVVTMCPQSALQAVGQKIGFGCSCMSLPPIEMLACSISPHSWMRLAVDSFEFGGPEVGCSNYYMRRHK